MLLTREDYKKIDTVKMCGVADCKERAIGEQTEQQFWGNYITIRVCEKHAWNCLKNTKCGESGGGISIGWERY